MYEQLFDRGVDIEQVFVIQSLGSEQVFERGRRHDSRI
jgi:hypothetical protein